MFFFTIFLFPLKTIHFGNSTYSQHLLFINSLMLQKIKKKGLMKLIEGKENQESYGIDETLPHQISSPSFKGTGIKMQPPFVNSFGVTIGDSIYNSSHSPLENWTSDTDPEIMAGEEWVHPTNDIGWNTTENRELLESKRTPQGYPFMHPTKDVSHGKD
jgi:hypothetical protein